MFLHFGSIGRELHRVSPLTAGPGLIIYPPLTLGGVTGELRMALPAIRAPCCCPNGAARLTAAEVNKHHRRRGQPRPHHARGHPAAAWTGGPSFYFGGQQSNLDAARR